MGRLAINVLAWCSGMLCIGSAVLFVRSYRHVDSWMYYRTHHVWQQLWIDPTMQTFSRGRVMEVDSRRGVVRFVHLLNDWSYSRASRPFHWSIPLDQEQQNPMLRFLRERRRRSLGQCLACGYDVRASPDRCPECGVAVANSSSTPSTVAP